MKFKLMKTGRYKTYKSIIVEPQIRDFFTGRIWTRNHTPFPKEKIEKYIERGYFKIKSAISLSLGSFKKRSYQCNRCHNTNQQEFIEFNCAKCDSKCVYCRHCINMGRMSNCTELILWNGPKPKQKRNQVLDWQGQFTDLQQKAANELIHSLEQNRNHLVHAV